MNFKLAALSVLMAATVLPITVHAEDPAVPSTTFNIGAVSDYRYRGISQSGLKPALQGGADYSNPNGLYLGTWLSTIKWIKDIPGGNASIEWDIYGGYKGEIAKDFGYDVGVLAYVYPSNNLKPSANTTEIYGALSYGPVTAKYSHALTNTFGFGDSKGSGYFDLSATFDLGNGFSLVPHVGRQTIEHSRAANYTDYSLTLSKDFGNGFTLSAAAVGTDASKTSYVTPDNKFTGKSALVLGAKYSF